MFSVVLHSRQQTPLARSSPFVSAVVYFFSKEGHKTNELASTQSIALHVASSTVVLAKGLQKS